VSKTGVEGIDDIGGGAFTPPPIAPKEPGRYIFVAGKTVDR